MRFALSLLALAAGALAASSGSASATGSPSVTGSAPSTSGSGTPGAAGLSPCALGCIEAAATASACGSFTNATCVCTDADFQARAGTCLQAECKPAEAQAALAANAANCGPLSLTPTASATVTAPFLPSNTAADISASGSGSGASPSGSGASPSGSNGTNSTSPSATGSGGNSTSTNKPSGAAPALLGSGFVGLVGAAVVAVLAGVVV
ncbi:hypothetical protein B0H16DRAFT_1507894 [Mycena metata]|uniref:CFEM domain-containing protein n=1 Tax=Mycena metata TaxID=1033252 RepID=A0AAD7NUH0_9AGAR|nr:hypothetical protein B0H16DRAFT_1507894 [Mycena metata]